jgi:hypothetical protein
MTDTDRVKHVDLTRRPALPSVSAIAVSPTLPSLTGLLLVSTFSQR